MAKETIHDMVARGTLPLYVEAKRIMLDEFERDYFTKLDAVCGGNISAMARAAGMERTHVRSYLERHGIGGRVPVVRPKDAERHALAELRSILLPLDGESLTDAASRVVAEAEQKASKRRASKGAGAERKATR
jgi:hypothetical protein